MDQSSGSATTGPVTPVEGRRIGRPGRLGAAFAYQSSRPAARSAAPGFSATAWRDSTSQAQGSTARSQADRG